MPSAKVVENYEYSNVAFFWTVAGPVRRSYLRLYPPLMHCHALLDLPGSLYGCTQLIYASHTCQSHCISPLRHPDLHLERPTRARVRRVGGLICELLLLPLMILVSALDRARKPSECIITATSASAVYASLHVLLQMYRSSLNTRVSIERAVARGAIATATRAPCWRVRGAERCRVQKAASLSGMDASQHGCKLPAESRPLF